MVFSSKTPDIAYADRSNKRLGYSCGGRVWHFKSRDRYRWIGAVQARINYEGACNESYTVHFIYSELKSLIPVVMSGIIAVYGLVVSVLIAGGRKCAHILFHWYYSNLRAVDPRKDYSLYAGFVHLAAGLACGMTGLAAGYAIGLVGDSVNTVFFYIYQTRVTDVCSVYEPTSMNRKFSSPWC